MNKEILNTKRSIVICPKCQGEGEFDSIYSECKSKCTFCNGLGRVKQVIQLFKIGEN